MRDILLILSICTLAFTCQAQSLSIDELWAQCSDHHALAKEKATAVKVQQEQLAIRRSAYLPVVYGDLDWQRNLIIPTTPVPAIAFDPGAPEDAVIPLKFSTKWNSKAGLKLEWTLFDPKRKSNLSSDRIAEERAILQEQEYHQDLKSAATLAYAAVVLATRQYKSAIEDSIQYAEIQEIVAQRFQAGRATSDEYILAQQELQRKRIRLHESWTILQENSLDLGEYVDLTDIRVLSSDLSEIRKKLEAYRPHPFQIDLLQLDIRSAELDLRALQKEVLPTLHFNAYFGAQFYSNDFHLFQHNNWYGHSFVNLGVRVPISAYFTQSASRKKAALQQEIYTHRLEHQQYLEKSDEQKKQLRIAQAEAALSSREKIEQLAEQKKTQKWAAYQSGRLLLSDYHLAHSEHLSAQQEVWQAQYDWLAALLATGE